MTPGKPIHWMSVTYQLGDRGEMRRPVRGLSRTGVLSLLLGLALRDHHEAAAQLSLSLGVGPVAVADDAVVPKTVAGIDRTALEEMAGGPVTKFKTQRLATLWAGYGTLTALHLTVAPEHAAVRSTNLVVKRVHAPSVRNTQAAADWLAATPEARARKIGALMTEQLFYKLAAPRLIGAGIHLPRPLSVDITPGDALEATLVLSDLREQFPISFGAASVLTGTDDPTRPGGFEVGGGARRLSPSQRRAALRWLASFHAHFVNADAPALASAAGREVKPGPPWTGQPGGFW